MSHESGRYDKATSEVFPDLSITGAHTVGVPGLTRNEGLAPDDVGQRTLRTNKHRRHATVQMSLLVAVPLGLSSSSGSLIAILPVASLLLVASIWVVANYTKQFVIGIVLITTLVPIVGFPTHKVLYPGVLALIVVACTSVVGLLPRRRPQMTMVDVAALVVLAGCACSVAYGHENKSNFEHVLFFWFCPYFAARAITGSGYRTTVLKAFAVAGAVAIPFGIIEGTYGNLFLKIFTYGTERQHGLGVPTRRLGITRAEGALGQPIPFAMFLSIAAVAAITLWMTRENRRSNRWLYIGLGIVAIQATTLARTGWLMLAVVAGVVIALSFRTIVNDRNRRFVALAAIGAVVILAVPQTNALILGGSGTGSVQLEVSANYRSLLLRQALQPGYINPLGTAEPQIGPLGSKSIDDEYIHAAWMWGYLPLVGFALMFLAFTRGAWRYRRDIVALAVYATCISTMVAIQSVAFLTQQEVLIWLLWGCASGLAVRPAQRKLKSGVYAVELHDHRPRTASSSEDSHRARVLV
jgi:hypothetical protein